MGHVIRLDDWRKWLTGRRVWDRIVRVLLSEPGRPFKTAEIAQAIYSGADGGPDWAPSVIRRTIWTGRGRCDLPVGWEISTQWARGYSLVEIAGQRAVGQRSRNAVPSVLPSRRMELA